MRLVFSGFSASAVPPVTVFPPPQDHRVQQDMRGLIRQISADELKSLSRSRKRSRSRSSSVEPVRQERRMSHRAPDSGPLDEHDGNAIDVQVSMGNDSSGASKDNLPADSAPNDLNSGFLTVREPKLQITTFPDEKIGSDDESDDQNQEKLENDDDGNSEQTSVPAQLPYIEVLELLRSRLGSKLCPKVVPDDPKSGASALKVQEHCPSSSTSEKIEVVSKINSRIQGDNPIEGFPFDSYP